MQQALVSTLPVMLKSSSHMVLHMVFALWLFGHYVLWSSTVDMYAAAGENMDTNLKSFSLAKAVPRTVPPGGGAAPGVGAVEYTSLGSFTLNEVCPHHQSQNLCQFGLR